MRYLKVNDICTILKTYYNIDSSFASSVISSVIKFLTRELSGAEAINITNCGNCKKNKTCILYINNVMHDNDFCSKCSH